MNDERAVRIEVEWDNGRIERAEGEDATTIWRAIQGGFAMNQLHGMPYNGPKMKVIKDAERDSANTRSSF